MPRGVESLLVMTMLGVGLAQMQASPAARGMSIGARVSNPSTHSATTDTDTTVYERPATKPTVQNCPTLARANDSLEPLGLHGSVVVQLVVNADGSAAPARAFVVQSTDHHLDTLATAVALACRFSPGKNTDNEPVRARVWLPIRFGHQRRAGA